MPDDIENVYAAGQHDQTYHIGVLTNFQTGTHGNTWSTQIKRYARRIQSTSGGGGGYYRINEMLDPRSIVDPRYGLSNLRLRARECMAVTFPNGTFPSATATASAAWWGFSGMPNALSGANTLPFPFVGFRLRYDRTAGGVITNAIQWRCTVIGDACTILHESTVSAVTYDPQTPHEFELLFDGLTSTVFWLIDGVVVDSYTFPTNTAPGQQTPYPAGGLGTAAGAWNMIYASNNSGGVTFVTEFLYHMSPGTPLMSIEEASP